MCLHTGYSPTYSGNCYRRKMISAPKFMTALPEAFSWLEEHDWNTDSSFSGYIKLYKQAQDATAKPDPGSKGFGCYALGRWFNKLMLDVFETEQARLVFVQNHPPGSICKEDLHLFLSLLIAATRTAIPGLFNDDLEWELCDQTELSRRWPSTWYMMHIQNGIEARLPNMHNHIVPFCQDYNVGLKTDPMFYQQCLEQIRSIADSDVRAKMLLALIACQAVTPSIKIRQLHNNVELEYNIDEAWSWIGHYLVVGHIGEATFKASYEQLTIALVSPYNLASGGNLAHPVLPHIMQGLVRFQGIENEAGYDLIGTSEIKRLGWIFLESATSDDKDHVFINYMKELEAEPWDTYDALAKNKFGGGEETSALDIPDSFV